MPDSPVLVCDLDDTLLDRDGVLKEWAADVAQRHGAPEAVREIVLADRAGRAAREDFLGRAVMALGVPDGRQLMIDYNRAMVTRARPVKGAVETLRAVRARGWKVAVVTNGSQLQLHKLVAAELHTLVDVLVISDLVNRRKPDAWMAHAAITLANGRPASSAVVGDDLDADIAMARAAGLTSIWLSHGKVVPTGPAPDYIVNKVSEIVELVDGPLRPESTGPPRRSG